MLTNAGEAGLKGNLLQKGDKPGLLEVVITGQSFRNSLLFHHHERNAVGKRPILVGAACVERRLCSLFRRAMNIMVMVPSEVLWQIRYQTNKILQRFSQGGRWPAGSKRLNKHLRAAGQIGFRRQHDYAILHDTLVGHIDG